MDVAALSTGLSMTNVAGQVDTGVLSAVQNLDKTLVADLFGSLGLGTKIDKYA
ncbi:MAG TPA: hypothetical protein VIG51_05760 [Candidatus Baltobacteraceae bacterium]|jgi:hypothetical protein